MLRKKQDKSAENLIRLVETLKKIKPTDKKTAKFNAIAMRGRGGRTIYF